MMPIDQMVLTVTRTDNLSAHRFFGMGFGLGAVEVFEDLRYVCWRVRAAFRCVCGREEMFGGILPSLSALDYFNIFRQLHEIGSLSREHLLKDGYSAAQIDAMERNLEDYSRRYDVPTGDPRRLYWPHPVPPVPFLAQDFAVRNMREGRYVRLPERPESLEWRQGHWNEVPRLFRYPTMPGVP